MKGKLNLWQNLLLAGVIVGSFCLAPRSDIPGIASTAAGPLIPVDTGESDCIRLATPVNGRESIGSSKGDLRYPMQSIPEESATNAASSVGAFPGSISNSRNLEIPALADTSAWECYKDGGPACYSALNSVTMVSADEGWAVGYGGMVLHYLDGDWQVVIAPTPLRSLESLSMLNANDGWAVGFDHNQQKTLFLHWDGNAWSELDTQNIGAPLSVDMISAADGWAVGGPHAILHWDGSAWQAVDNPVEEPLFSVDMLSSTDGWAVGGYISPGNDATILHWDGSAWTIVPSPTNNALKSVSMLSSSDGWAVGPGGTIAHWDGSEWQLVSSPTSSGLSAVKMVTSNDGWAVGERGMILHWNGNNWQTVTSPMQRTLYSISMPSASDGWAVGWKGTILHWDGSQWLGVITPSDYHLTSVSMVSQNDGWAGGWDADRYRTLFLQWDGMAWQPAASPTEDSYIQFISMVSTSDGWALGWDYFTSTSDIFHWDGSSWQAVLNPAPGTFLSSISMLTSTDGWIVGEEGTALYWDGAAWKSRSDGIPVDYKLNAISMISSDDGWAVGVTESGSQPLAVLVHWNGSTWQTYESDYEGGLASVDMVSSNDGWAMGRDNDFLHWNGTTWKTVSNSPYSLSLTSIFMLSSTDGWAVGDVLQNGYSRSSIAHWDGQAWLDSPSPTEVGLSSVWMLSPYEGWAVGMGAILHYQRKSPELYLPLIFQDYRRCGQDSLVNGNFEQDDVGWRLFTSGTGPKAHDLIGSQEEGFSPYAGDYAARLGGYEGVWDTLEQTVMLPEQGRLSYWWKMGTYETLPHHDGFSVDLFQSDGTLVAQLAHHDDQDLEGEWQQDVIDVSAFSGQELVLRFASYNDNYYFSWFDLDEVSLCSP